MLNYLQYKVSKIILCHELWIWYYRIWILPQCEYDATDCFHGILSHVFSNWLPEMRHSHTCCICLAFLHCGFSNVSSHLFKNFKSPSAFCLKTASKTDHLLQMQIVKGFNAEYQTSFHHLQLESRPPGHSDQLPGDLLHFYFEFQSILSNWIEYNES